MWWLANRLGFDRFLRCDVALPEERFFPDPYHGTEECVRKLVDRIKPDHDSTARHSLSAFTRRSTSSVELYK